MVLHAGDLLADRYLIQERLGTGASGVHTFAAVDRQGDTPVVIKELVLRDIEGWKPYDLFEREAQVLASLDHPSVPRVLSYFGREEPGNLRLYLVMTRLPGLSLAARLAAGWHPGEDEVRAIATRTLAILGYLHDRQPPVVHRDLKPSNLLLADDGEVSLVDFGGVLEAIRPRGGSTVVGTYGYMAPEQFAGHAVPASDLYGLGATVVHLLTGVPPAQIPHQELRMNFRPLVHCSENLSRWLEQLLEPAVERRPGTAVLALQALQAPALVAVPAPLPTPRRPERPTTGQWGTALALAAIALTGTLYHLEVRAHLEQTAALFIGLPTIMAIALALAPHAHSRTGRSLRWTTIALLMSGPLLHEGMICILMAAPLFYLVGLIISRVFSDELRSTPRTYVQVCLPLLLMSLEGVHPVLSFPRDESVGAERVVAAPAAEVERQLSGPLHFGATLPLYLRLGFPRPVDGWGSGLQPGARRVVHFAGGEGEPGDTVWEVTSRGPGLVRWRAVSDHSKIAHWLDWQGAEISWRALDAEHTVVRWQIHYVRRLDPAWYFVPWERYAVWLAAGYGIDNLAAPGKHR